MQMKDITEVSVLYHGAIVGRLRMIKGKCVFEYDKSWLAEGFSISPLELPLKEELFVAGETSTFGNFGVFNDSIPDGYGLYLINKMLRLHGLSIWNLSQLQLLSIVGSSGMGALEYRPQIDFIPHQDRKDVSDYEELQRKAWDVLSEKDESSASLLYYNSGNSGGARPKVVLSDKDNRHWIVKFRHLSDPEDLGKTEFEYMKTAERCGIKIPEVKLVEGKYFATERFDISKDGIRLHTSTAAGLLGVDFRAQTADYSNLLALTGYLTPDPAQVEQMFRLMVFNIVSINKDDHSKNFSFIYREPSGWELAPAYDLTYSPEGTRGEHSTSIMFKGNPSLDDVLKAGTGIRISKNRCLDIVGEIQTICAQHLEHTVKLLD